MKTSSGGSCRDLDVWAKGMDLVDAIYDITRKLPDEERYALCTQMRRAVVSVPANIAEGYGRMTRGEYVHHLRYANGSLKEVETQLLVAGRQGYITKTDAKPAGSLLQEVGKMLLALIRKLS